MFLTKDGQHLPILFHNYELLLICLNILMCESHWESQTQYVTFFKTVLQKIIMNMTVGEYMVSLGPHTN